MIVIIKEEDQRRHHLRRGLHRQCQDGIINKNKGKHVF